MLFSGLSIILLLFVLGLGILVLVKGEKNFQNRIFFIFVICVFLWLLANSALRFIDDYNIDLWILRVTFVTGALMIYSLFCFSLEFPKKLFQRTNLYILLAALPTAAIIAVSLTDLLVRGLSRENNIVLAQYGPAYQYFLAYTALFLLLVFVALSIQYRTSKDILRIQTRFLFVGIVASAVGVFIFAFVAPLLFKDNSFSNFDPYAIVFLVIFAAYAIFKHHLMSVKVIAAEVLTVTMLVLILVEVFIAGNIQEIIFRLIIFGLAAIFGYFLIKSVIREVKQREEMQRIANKLRDTINELEIANDKLKKLDEAKSNFVSIASHQLRTPITGIKGYLSMFMEGDYGELSDKQKKVIQMNLDAVERMVKLIDVFLDISRIEADRVQLTKEMVQLGDIINSVVKELRPMAEKKGLKLYEEIKGKLPETYVDPQKIRQVVLNLIDNATKYTVEGSVKIIAWAKGNKIIVEVKDTGIGIAKEEVHRLFSKFVRAGGGAKIDQSGSGLGLFIIKGLVEAHGGKVYVKSEGEGKGTTFGFILNVEQEPKKKN